MVSKNFLKKAKKVVAFSEQVWYHIRAEKNSEKDPGVAKFGIALEWGSRGPEFESQHSDQSNRSCNRKIAGSFISL